MGKQLKSQVSLEFVFLVAIAFTIMVVFIASTRSEFNELRGEEEMSLVKDVSFMIQHELVIASNVEDGYIRTFEIPQKLNTIDYDIDITNNLLITNSSGGYEYALNVPDINGTIQKGANKINKTEGVIYLN